MNRQALSLLASMLFTAAPALALAGTAPTPIPFPPEVKTFEIAGELQVNGVPMRISGFVSPKSPETVRQWLLQKLPKKPAEAAFGTAQVLGYAEGKRYVSLQIRPERNPMGGTGTRVTVSVSRHASAIEQERYTTAMQRWRVALPARGQTLSHMTSVDNGLHSTYLTVKNRLGVTYNRHRMSDILLRQGWQHEQMTDRTPSSVRAVKNVPSITGSQAIDWFRAKNGDQALLTTTASQDGSTQVVLNILARDPEFAP